MSRMLCKKGTQVFHSIEKKEKGQRIDALVRSARKAPKDGTYSEKEVKVIKLRSPYAAKKRTPRAACRELDFSAYPVTGMSLTVGVEKMLKTRQIHMESAEAKRLNPLIIVSEDAPSIFKAEPVIDSDGESLRELKPRGEYLAELKEWMRKKVVASALNDKPAAISRNEPKDGKLLVIEPEGNKARGKDQTPAFRKDEPKIKLDLEGTLKLKPVIAEAMRKSANSWRREIPLPLCMWMIANQEDWDSEMRRANNIIKDKAAYRLIQWMHMNAY